MDLSQTLVVRDNEKQLTKLSQTPGPGAYNFHPSSQKQNSAYSISQSKRFTQGKQMTPGPGTYHPTLSSMPQQIYYQTAERVRTANIEQGDYNLKPSLYRLAYATPRPPTQSNQARQYRQARTPAGSYDSQIDTPRLSFSFGRNQRHKKIKTICKGKYKYKGSLEKQPVRLGRNSQENDLYFDSLSGTGSYTFDARCINKEKLLPKKWAFVRIDKPNASFKGNCNRALRIQRKEILSNEFHLRPQTRQHFETDLYTINV